PIGATCRTPHGEAHPTRGSPNQPPPIGLSSGGGPRPHTGRAWMRLAVVGHVEWVQFVRVEHTPAPGDIVHALEWWEEPGGGGSVAAVQLAKLGGSASFFTALGDDALGHRAHAELGALGIEVWATFRPTEQRRAITLIDGSGERTITIIGERLGPRGGDPAPWEDVEEADAVYFTAGDDEALRRARRAT